MGKLKNTASAQLFSELRWKSKIPLRMQEDFYCKIKRKEKRKSCRIKEGKTAAKF